MSLRRLLSQTVTVVRRSETTVDEYDTPIPTDEPGGGVEYAARLEQLRSDENTTDRQTAIADWIVYLPPEAELDAGDRVEFSDDSFEVVGPPERVANRNGTTHHVEARLRFVKP